MCEHALRTASPQLEIIACQSQQEGKKRIKKYVIKKNKEEIEEEMKKGKKTKDLNECSKEYMSKLNFNEARMIFLLKSNMINKSKFQRTIHKRPIM